MKSMFVFSLALHAAVMSALLLMSRSGRSSVSETPKVYSVSLVTSSSLLGGARGSSTLRGGVERSPRVPGEASKAVQTRSQTESPAPEPALPRKGVGRVEEKASLSRNAPSRKEKPIPKSEVPEAVAREAKASKKARSSGPEGYKRKGSELPSGLAGKAEKKADAKQSGASTGKKPGANPSADIGAKSGTGGYDLRPGGQAASEGGHGALAAGQAGSRPGGSDGGMRLDSAFDFPDYLAAIRSRIWQNWIAPFEGSGVALRRAVVFFKILRDGKVAGVYVEYGSGSLPFDKSAFDAVTAVNRVEPLPPLPGAFSGENLGVHFVFEYDPELM